MGRDANPSPIAASRIAVMGAPARSHVPRASSEQAPQAKSNQVSFQKLLGFTKDAMKTSKGKNPAKKILAVAHISALAESAAKVPIKGASAHMAHVTRFGFVLPARVSRMYV